MIDSKMNSMLPKYFILKEQIVKMIDNEDNRSFRNVVLTIDGNTGL